MGREWNEKLDRRLQDSILRACDKERAGSILITDLENSELSLVEVLSECNSIVIAQFLTKPKKRPDVLRYREEYNDAFEDRPRSER